VALANVLLTINEAAELEGKKYHSLYRNIERNKLKAIKINTNEKRGFEYRIDINDLSDKAKRRYYARLKTTEVKALAEKDEKYLKSVEELTDVQRQEISYWKKILDDWQEYISHPGRYKQTTKATEEFISIFNIQNPDKTISSRTLRRKLKEYREFGEVALADHRSNKKKGKSSIDEVIWSVFLQWWLDENQPTVSYVYKNVCSFAAMRMDELLPLPSEDTFRRAIGKIPKPVVKYFREGKKAFEDGCLPYLVRQYDLIDSNDIWTADYHTLDIMVRDDITGKVFRPHAVVWLDIRSRKMLSMRLCESSNSDGVILAFRDAIKKFGICKEVYLDNGREFLVHDFGGRGKRKANENADYGSTILERLGIKMTNARVKNARAKVIERTFKQVTEEFAKLYITYCGNRPGNRPERHNKVLKNVDKIPLLSQVKEEFWTYLEGNYNMESSKAEGLDGMSPNECYAEHLMVKKTATEEQLNEMLARSSNLQSVDRNCVFLRFGDGKKIWFYSEEIVSKYFKEKVYVRYDSEDLSMVQVYDEKERLVGPAYRMEIGGYNSASDKESIKKLNSKAKKMKKSVKEYMESSVDLIDAPEMREIMLEAARKNIEEKETSFEAKVVEPINFKRGDELESAAVGNTNSIVALDRMIKNARKNKETEE